MLSATHALLSIDTPQPPPSTLFPYTTLFRSDGEGGHRSRCERNEEDRGDPAGLRTSGGGHGSGQIIRGAQPAWRDRKSTRLNSSHGYISYAVFCLKKKTAVINSCVVEVSSE